MALNIVREEKNNMQNDVNLSTKDDELGIKYGPYKYGMIASKPRELAFASVGYLMNDMFNIRENYIRLGFHLFECRRNRYYMDFGYSSLVQFCAANLGLDSSSVSRCINVFLAFSASEKGVHKMWLDDKYKEYSYSQLCEMVSMNDETRRQVTPHMTIKQIREVKKLNVSQNVSPVATSQQKKFDYKKYVKLKGAAESNYIKRLDAGRSIALHIFNRDGKCIIPGLIVDFLESGEHGLYIRLLNDGSAYFK